MKAIFRFVAIFLLIGCGTAAWAQSIGSKISRVDIKFIGPASVSEALIRDNIKLTFQDDHVAFKLADMLGPNQLMWANDFPHSDSTWPWSQDVIAEQTSHMKPEQKQLVLRDNVRAFYGLA